MYDSAGRLRRRQIPLDPLLAPAFRDAAARREHRPDFPLGQVIWFSGEKQLAITFSLPPRSDIGEDDDPVRHHRARPDACDRSTRSSTSTESPTAPAAWRYPLLDTGVVWDLKTDQNTMLSGALTFEFWNNPLPLAYQYTLERHGRTCPCPGDWRRYSGDAGDWQSPGRRIVPAMAVWRAGRVATGGSSLSVDRRAGHLADDICRILARWPVCVCASYDEFAGLPPLSRASPQDPENAGLPPILLARDAGFAHIMRSIPQYVPGAAQPLIYVAWRPDGKSDSDVRPARTTRS